MREIPEVSDTLLAFPANVIGSLLPLEEEIPDEFPHEAKFAEVAQTWFFCGLSPESKFRPKEGVNSGKALRVLQACLGSYEPRHEHKMRGVAFLMSEWFEDIEAIPKTKPEDLLRR